MFFNCRISSGRIYIPSILAKKLTGKLIISKSPDGCLFLCTLNRWQEISREFNSLFRLKDPNELRIRKNRNSWRIFLAPGFREYAGLDREVVVVMIESSGYLEIWSKKRWTEEQNKPDKKTFFRETIPQSR
ncbi:MAG: hypothetical protein ABIG40_01295 [Parcubacteria group bacterium]